MPLTLDFAALPSDDFFISRSVLTTLPDQIEARLAPLPLSLERVRSSVMFAELSSKQTEDWRAAAYIRAALVDFCSIEEVQKSEQKKLIPLRLENLTNPLFHLLELTRHLNIHVKSVKAESHVVPASFNDQAFDMKVYLISNLDATDLAQLRNGKRYSLDDLKKMVAWFSTVQVHWGAGYVLRVGAELLALELCQHFGL